MTPNQNNREAAVYLALSQIPAGKVIAYGELAKLAGFPSSARWVGRLLCQLPKESKLPWHRVINAQGKISLAEGSNNHKLQQQKLEAEGIVFKNGKIALREFGYSTSAN